MIPRPKILIVDDLPANLLALRKLLAAQDADILAASSGNEALALCLEHTFALALLDINMPGMDGYELASLMMDEPSTAGIPLIFVTAAYKDDAHRIRGYGVGAVDYIEKPIDDRILNSKVRVLLELYRGRQALAAKTAELERSNAELEQFAYVASHDLRQPLRMVSNYLGLISRRLAPVLDDDTRRFLGYAVSGAQRMDAMIRGLLEYSRIGRQGQPLTAVSLATIIADAIQNLEMAIAETGTILTIPDELPTLTGDPLELMRLFQNLIGNAIKYRAAGRAPEITLTLTRENAFWQIVVRDNGIGIAREDCERIFGIFQRLEHDEAVEGTGIGLAVCRKIVEHHGGRIWVESEPGTGSRFCFTLAASPKEPSFHTFRQETPSVVADRPEQTTP